MQQGLAARRINVSVSRAASTRYDFERRGLAEVVRASVHYYVTEEQLLRCVEAVRQLAAAAEAAAAQGAAAEVEAAEAEAAEAAAPAGT